jgi:hypothetical protein
MFFGDKNFSTTFSYFLNDIEPFFFCERIVKRFYKMFNGDDELETLTGKYEDCFKKLIFVLFICLLYDYHFVWNHHSLFN